MKTEIPEGYKNSPVGIIPEEWEVKRLEEIAVITSGATPSRKIADNWNGDIPWVTTSLLNNARILSAEEYITQTGLGNSATKILPVNTVLMAMYGQGQTRGKVSILCIEAATNQACAALIMNNGTRFDYIFYQLSNMYDIIRNLSNDGSQKNLNLQLIKNIQVILPRLLEQQKIAEIISEWDVAIEKQTLLIKKLELRKRALMQQLLAGRKRIKGFNGKVKKQQLKSYLLEISCRNSDNAITNVLSVTNSRGFISQSDQFERVVASEDVSKYKIVRQGQFAYNPSRINVGSLDILKHVDHGILSPMYIVFETNREHLNPNFLYYHLKSESFTKRIPMYVQGSVRDSLSFDGLTAMKFYIPPLPEQIAIAEILSIADKEIDTARVKLGLIKLQKKGLMQILLNGRTRVKI